MVIFDRTQGDLRIQLLCEGAEGRIDFGGTAYFGIDASEYFAEEKSMVAQNDRTPIEASILAQKFHESMMKLTKPSDSTPFQLDKELRSFLTDPEKNEPLSLYASDILATLANRNEKNVVVALPDSSFLRCRLVMRNKLVTLEQGVNALVSSGCRFEATDDWIIGSHKNVWQSSSSRAPRKAFKEFVRAIESTGYLTLDSRIAMAAAGATMLIPDDYLPFFGYRVSDFQEDFRLLKFLGTLSEGQKNEMMRNGRISVAILSPVQRQAIEDLVYARKLMAVKSLPGGVQSHDRGTFESEPSFSLGNGITSMEIATRVVERPALFGVTPQTPRYWLNAVDPSVIGNQIATREFFGENPNEMRFDRFFPGVARTLTITFRFPGELQWTGAASDPNFDAKAAPVTLEKLPADMRAKIDKAAETERERWRNKPPPPQIYSAGF